MLDAALFVTETIHEREITLADGTTHNLWFKPVKYDVLMKAQTTSSKAEEQSAAIDRLLVLSLCNPDGTPALTLEQVKDLYHGVRLACAAAIAEVNQLGSQVGKVSPPETPTSGSGTSSS